MEVTGSGSGKGPRVEALGVNFSGQVVKEVKKRVQPK